MEKNGPTDFNIEEKEFKSFLNKMFEKTETKVIKI